MEKKKKCRRARAVTGEQQHAGRTGAPSNKPTARVVLAMRRPQRRGSAWSPPRLLLLVYTSLCALGGECWGVGGTRPVVGARACVLVCVYVRARLWLSIHGGAVRCVGGAEILLRWEAAAGQRIRCGAASSSSSTAATAAAASVSALLCFPTNSLDQVV